MNVVDPEKLEWKTEKAWMKALVHKEKLGDKEIHLHMLEVPAGAQVPPHRHEKRREFHFVVYSGGARLQIGERIFRPTAGQSFVCEPGELMGVTNDTVHKLRLLITKIGYDSEDIQLEHPDEKPEELKSAEEKPEKEAEETADTESEEDDD